MINEYAPSIDTPVSQKYLKSKGLIVFLALLSAFIPLSTDLYLPALPTMTEYFNIQEYQTNLTLILFFIFFAVGTLVWGPLSDKYGRRPVLLTGLTVYTIASLLCATSPSIYHLIFYRILQAAGGSVANALATAIVKDTYQGRKREATLSIVQSMVVISPAVAPVLGALLLRLTSWRGVFVSQAVLGIIALLGSVVFQETLKSKIEGSIIHTLGRLAAVLKNPGFSSLLVTFSMVGVASLAFISSSTYIYQNLFGLSSQTYSFYFTFNAVGLLLGPLIYMRLSARFKRYSIVKACYIVMILSGIFVFAFGRLGPWVFALTLLPATIVCSCSRPPGTFLMLEQQKEDAGSASSLIGSYYTVMGTVGMVIVSFTPNNLIQAIGAINVVIGALCLTLWLTFTKKPFLSGVRQM